VFRRFLSSYFEILYFCADFKERSITANVRVLDDLNTANELVNILKVTRSSHSCARTYTFFNFAKVLSAKGLKGDIKTSRINVRYLKRDFSFRWYHGSITRIEAEGLLRVHQEGSYLVRNSESTKQDYSLSLK